MNAHPSYLNAYRTGTLLKTTEALERMLTSCALCPRRCGVNRAADERGFCATGAQAIVYSWLSHHGEEPPISGTRGSGTIFFSGCSMGCLYCQNHTFSQEYEGRQVRDTELAGIMLELQASGCHNINLVTPTHVLPQILRALTHAIALGLQIPLVYNTSAWEFAEILALLEGIVDIYLPDMRYGDDESARAYSCTPSYTRYNQEAVREMHRQVGIAQFDENGLLRRGMVIRHLVLPEMISGTSAVMEFIARQISPDTYVSLMSQYMPAHKASSRAPLLRRISAEEYAQAIQFMQDAGLHNGWTQEGHGLEHLAGTRLKPK
jgi:putative pyruvate formate lyase activating enzyme